jgi:hypothetical protein
MTKEQIDRWLRHYSSQVKIDVAAVKLLDLKTGVGQFDLDRQLNRIDFHNMRVKQLEAIA